MEYGSAAQYGLAVGGIIRHGEPESSGRAGYRSFLDPVRAFPHPGDVGSRGKHPAKEDLAMGGIIGQGVSVLRWRTSLRSFLRPIGAIPHPRIAQGWAGFEINNSPK